MDRIVLKIMPENDGRTVEGILRVEYFMSRSLLRKIKREGSVFLNEKAVFLRDRVKAGDNLAVSMDFDEKSHILPDHTPIEVVYEDNCLLAVNKPAGVIVHPVMCENTNTLANSVMGHWIEKGKTNPVFRPVFRIDRDTSGLVLIAGSRMAHAGLDRQLRNRAMRRTYIAVVHGQVHSDEGVIDMPVARKEGSMVERAVSDDGARAVTHYRVLKRLQKIDNASVLELLLETGRTHQIRVHMSHIGHPLLGDSLYGGSRDIISRQALHSYRIAFTHPETGDEMELKCDLPEDMKELTRLF